MSAERVVAFGERALRFPLATRGADRRALLASLREVAGVVDVVLAEDTGAVILGESAAHDRASEAVAKILASDGASAGSPASTSHRVVRVVYDGDDLAEVASVLGTSTDEVVAMHSAPDYEVAMLGFLPGFAYLRGLDPRLVLPRRTEPRARVPRGSVAIAAEYTAVYPLPSPGGWNLLGRAVGPQLFDEHGAALAVGDRVRFERAEPGELAVAQTLSSEPAPAAQVHLEILKAPGPAIVVDGGRFGHMHEGVPHGGAMVPAALARANVAAGNAPGAAAIEIFGALEVAARGGHILVADDVRGATVLADGESIRIATEGRTRVRYLAVRGGVDVPVVLGGRSTLLVAAMGGYRGRPLKRGDWLAPGTEGIAPATSTEPRAAASDLTRLRMLPGPDADERALDAIAGATFSVSARSDRIGTRLDGPALPAHSMQSAHDRRSRPMVRGAIEMTPSGLVVLGPDHPTTGGYPVVAVLAEAAIGALMSLPIGASLRLDFTS